MRPALLLILLTAAGCAPRSTAVQLSPDLAGADALASWELRNDTSWAARDGAIVLHTAGRPAGPIRKPGEWAILRSEWLADLSMTAEVRADADVARMGRDVLIFFGWQSPTRFYYAHLSNETTPPHNGIFLVDDADRRRIDGGTAIPRLMDADWHRVRLERDVDTGRIAVFLDDLPQPVLQATDTTLRAGRVGLGSFDDPMAFRAVEVRGTPAVAPR